MQRAAQLFGTPAQVDQPARAAGRGAGLAQRRRQADAVVVHAQLQAVGLHLQVQPDRLQLRVHDDGVGLPPALREAGAAPGRSRGLVNLRRRAEQLGGTLHFEPGPGTTLRLDLPLPVKSPAPGMTPDPLAA